MKLLVIIPAHNEAGSIRQVIVGLRHTCPQFDLVVVNDGSTDETVSICRGLSVPLLDLPINLGLADAVGAGMKYAWNKGYDAAVQFDADGQHLPESIAPMLEKLAEGYDIVIGSRFVTEKKPFTPRMLGSRFISWSIRLTTRKWLTDPTSGLRMYSRRIIREFAKEINHPPEPDTISYLVRKGARAAEIQVEMGERETGQSYLTTLSSIKYMLQMSVSILMVQGFRGGRFTDAPAQTAGSCAVAGQTGVQQLFESGGAKGSGSNSQRAAAPTPGEGGQGHEH